ncbi:transcription coactivator binding [Branchiostoma belcheri]|nr:transcription coactivator binding [Branchiostoma belcheri]
MTTSTAHIYKYLSLPDSLLQQLDQQRRDDLLCDITLKTAGQEWRAHKCVLSAHSGYFKSVFAAYDATEVQLDPVTEKGFSALLDYMYTAKLVLTKETAQDILVAAGFLEIVNVLSDCSTYLSGPEEQPVDNQPNTAGQKETTEPGGSAPPTQPQAVKLDRDPPLPPNHSQSSGGDGPYTCDICQAQFTRRSKILAHRRRHAVEKLFTCDICDETFSKKGPYLSHRRTHGTNLTCRKCSAEFSDEKSLEEHMKEHTEEDKFLCVECDRPFLSRSSLIQHKRRHTGEKPFTCKDCSKSFAQKTTLIRHCRSHTGEKPFACDLCQKRFSEKGNMLTHRRIHTGEKPFKCEVCETRFGKLSTLIQHRRQHTHKGEKPFTCEICNAAYTQKSHLVSHQKLKHMGQARFSCSFCSAQFDNKFHFTRHQRTHTGERPFQCDTGETIPIRVTDISPEISPVSHASQIQDIQPSSTTQTVQIVDLQANPQNATQALLQLCSIDHDYPQ